MSTNVQIEVTGVKDALRELNSIDKKARRRLTTDFRQIMDPVLKTGRDLIPDQAPMSGWERSWSPGGRGVPVLPFEAGQPTYRAPRQPKKDWPQSREGRRQMGKWMQWESYMRTYVSGKRPVTFGGYTRNLSAFGVRWLSPAAALFDTSATPRTPQGARMIATLQSRYGQSSRVIWKSWERSGGEVTDKVQRLINDLMRRVNGKLKA
jgi:hypothetical protein